MVEQYDMQPDCVHALADSSQEHAQFDKQLDTFAYVWHSGPTPIAGPGLGTVAPRVNTFDPQMPWDTWVWKFVMVVLITVKGRSETSVWNAAALSGFDGSVLCSTTPIMVAEYNDSCRAMAALEVTASVIVDDAMTTMYLVRVGDWNILVAFTIAGSSDRVVTEPVKAR